MRSEYYTNNWFRSLLSFFQITWEATLSQLMENGLGEPWQKVSWLNFRYFPQIRIERQKKFTKHEISVRIADLLCCIVMPSCTVLLFYPTHFYWCVLPYVYVWSCNSRAQVTPATEIVLIILYRPMFAETPERPGVQGWALKATNIHGTRQLMVNHLVLFWSLALHYAVTLNQAVSGTRRPDLIWRVQRQQWCLITLLFRVCVCV
jgi:hypothetical protein